MGDGFRALRCMYLLPMVLLEEVRKHRSGTTSFCFLISSNDIHGMLTNNVILIVATTQQHLKLYKVSSSPIHSKPLFFQSGFAGIATPLIFLQCSKNSKQQVEEAHRLDSNGWGENFSTMKHDSFVNSPMINKSVRAIPGIDAAYSATLMGKQIAEAYQIYGKFLVLKMDQEAFMAWLRSCGVRDNYTLDCYHAMRCYSLNNL